MLSSKAPELAKQLSSELESIKGRLTLLEDRLREYDLFELVKQVAGITKQLEGIAEGAVQVTELAKLVAVLDERVAKLEKRAEITEKQQERLAVVESQQVDMKKAKEESDKRQWQFVYIFAGAMASLLVTVVVQLVLAFVKKP